MIYSNYIEKEALTILEDVVREYNKRPEGVEVEFRKLCGGWEWAKRSDAYTHLFHKYPAKTLAYIPIFLLSTQKYVKQKEPILDIFSGTSTILVESIVHPVFPRSAYGIELNPLARLIGKVKTKPISINDTLESAEKVVNEARISSEIFYPESLDTDYWFPKNTISGIGKLVHSINNINIDNHQRDFLLVCLSSIIRKCSYADPKIPVPVRLKAEKYKQGSPRRNYVDQWIERVEKEDPITLFMDTVNINIGRIRKLNSIKAISSGVVESEIIGNDARKIRFMKMDNNAEFDENHYENIPDGCIPCIITSPPYGSAQKYIRATKLEMKWLNIASNEEINTIDEEIIGTERIRVKEYSQISLTGYKKIDKTIEAVYERNLSRAGLVSAYFRNMDLVIQEAYRVLKDDGTLVLIIGDNTAAGIPIKNHEFLKIIAESKGLNTELILKDPVKSRGMITKRHETAGIISDDWVMIFRKGN